MRIRSIVAAGLLASGIAGSAAAWHNHLTKSAPAADEQLAKSPSSIRLWFAEKPVAKFTSISLEKDSAKIEVGKTATTDDPLSVSAEIAKPLAAGKYTVSWRTAGDDGHAIRGKYSFSVQ